MIKIFIAISGLLIGIPQILTGQYLQFMKWNPIDTMYSVPMTFPADAVADDFGPRRHTSNYHLGIDYNCAQDDGNNDKWNMILAPEGGTTVDVNRLCTSQFTYKQLCYQSGDHRYIFGHVYDNSSTDYSKNHGTIVLKKMLAPNSNKWAQIFKIKVTINGIKVTLTYILGQIDGGLVELNGDTLVATSQITGGFPLVPLGDADAKNQAHLHLNTVPINESFSTPSTFYASNPLQYINYAGTLYDLRLFCNESSSLFLPKYDKFGGSVSPMALQVKMKTGVSGEGNKRYDHVFDVDNVEFLLKGVGESSFKLISGKSQESKIELGGLLGKSIVNHPNPSFGSWSKTGVDSRAYNSGYSNQPYDIYHYSDFYTRIHKYHISGSLKTAELPLNARYPDGDYELFAKVTNIRNQVTNSDTIAFTLDNFRPYVSRVTISQGNNAPFYDAEWYDSSNSDLDKNGRITFDRDENIDFHFAPDAPLTINVYTSEPMDSLMIDSLRGAFDFKLATPLLNANAAKNIWTITTVGAVHLKDSVEYTLFIRGVDQSGNQILNLGNSLKTDQGKQLFGPYSLPLREDTSGDELKDWSPIPKSEGLDTIHRFMYKLCPAKLWDQDFTDRNRTIDCIDPLDVVYEKSNSSGLSDGWAVVHVSPGIQDWTITWKDIDGNILSTDTLLSGLNPGIYC